jgi:hypothetical protein
VGALARLRAPEPDSIDDHRRVKRDRGQRSGAALPERARGSRGVKAAR